MIISSFRIRHINSAIIRLSSRSRIFFCNRQFNIRRSNQFLRTTIASQESIYSYHRSTSDSRSSINDFRINLDYTIIKCIFSIFCDEPLLISLLVIISQIFLRYREFIAHALEAQCSQPFCLIVRIQSDIIFQINRTSIFKRSICVCIQCYKLFDESIRFTFCYRLRTIIECYSSLTFYSFCTIGEYKIYFFRSNMNVIRSQRFLTIPCL